ncbi:MAG: SpoIIE family protein phosphatase [Bacteroidia bacterium]|nr:SpoIIE family protein phosphatase [Bacteroidia bacterium]
MFNKELEQKNVEITEQRDLVSRQKEQIEIIHEELTDSIYYAERIQKAVLPDLENILGNSNQSDKTPPLTDYFILFKPKNIVSGDFYWMAKRRNWLLAAVADCTGHGVPGAFMSMLGISFLNEIVAREDVQTAGQTLDELRKYIIKSLQQKGISGEQKDGMDMTFVAIDTELMELQYAGANNPLYIVSSQQEAVAVGFVMTELPTTNYQLPTTNCCCQRPTFRTKTR